ncbi:hypothetical protein ABK040_016781 [Willaertia magna]
MTEFYDLGKHCEYENCHEKDFLPFRCDFCHKTFCLQHRTCESHHCPNQNIGDVQVPICPICNTILPFKNSRKDPNETVERHLMSGECNSKTSSSSTAPTKKKLTTTCAFNGCDHKALIKCKQCRLNFCVDHRLDFEHDCEFLKQQKKASSSSSISNLIGPFFNQKTKTQKPTKTLQPSKVLANSFQNKKFQPIGQSSIEQGDRYFLDVYFPIQSKVPPIHMFFHKGWKIGKILDKIAEQGKIINKNATEQDKTKRLNLFTFKGEKLPTDKKLNEIDSTILSNRDAVILEYGDELNSEFIQQTLEKISNGENVEYLNQCIIC